jgi:aminopeptidase N
MLRMVEGKLGTAQFDAVLKDWYQEHRFQAVSAHDFVSYVKDRTGQDFAPMFESWNNLRELPRLRDRSRVQGNKLQVNLEATSALPKGLELPVVLHGRNGERELRWVDPTSPSTIEVPFEIARHEWDPERMVCASVW